MKIGRNDPCPCGSGKKYKKCCIDKNRIKPKILPNFGAVDPQSAEANSVMKEFLKQQPPEENLDLVKSVEWNGFKWRAIYSKLYKRPLPETFHEFILRVLVESFGEDWRQDQLKLEGNNRHVLVRWFDSYQEWRKTNQTKENMADKHLWGALPTGDVFALLQFAYDFYCLQVINKLPDHVTKRLKNNREFQGARYEIAVAAIIARAGFEIIFIEEKDKSKKKCEFLAKHKISGEVIGVEAKSRRRKGVLNEIGEFNDISMLKGDIHNLVLDALKQRPDNMPYIIFVDLNVKTTPGVAWEQKPWFNDIKSVVDTIKALEEGKGAKENALIITNYSYYYVGNVDRAPAGESLHLVPINPQIPIKTPDLLNRIFESVNRYSVIPKEV